MTPVEVWLRLDGEDLLAGTLYSHRRRQVEAASFSYHPGYLSARAAYALDPALPLVLGAQQTRFGQSLFGALTDCAPDRWGRTLVLRREAALARAEARPVRQLSETDYLLGVRDDLRQGALRFRTDGGSFLADDDSGVPALTDLPQLLDLAARAESPGGFHDAADLADLQRLVRIGSSLGGARPKAHVQDSGGRIAIAKFPSANADTWNVMAWERVALDLAHQAGIEVPAAKLLNLAGRSVLVVQRFDRTETGQRVGYVSAMTMLEAADGDQRSCIEIAEVIENTSARATFELQQLWRRMVFNVLISNTDDHLRNHGFLHVRGDVWRLAPAFDLNPNPAPGPTFLSTTLDVADDRASVGLALSVADYFRLSADDARTVLKDVTLAVSHWRQVARRHGLTEPEVTRMEPAFRGLSEVG